MVRESSVMKLSNVMVNLYKIYPDLEKWNYKELFKRKEEGFADSVDERTFRSNRKAETMKTTNAICSFIEMGFDERGEFPDGYFKKLIMYYLVLMDAMKHNLDFEAANKVIFEGM